MVNKLAEKDTSVHESLETVLSEIEVVKESIEDSRDNYFASNNQQIINNYNYNDSKTLFNVSFSKPAKERLDHITKDMMLDILNHDNLNDTLSDLTRSIYFHPKAPENWKWCVIDLHSQNGALEYNHETNTLIRKNTTNVIRKNLENIMFPVTDLLEELRRTRNFNKPQAINCSRLINQLGNEFTSDQINSVKQSAYAGRNFPKALWESVSISVEKTPFTCQIKGPK